MVKIKEINKILYKQVRQGALDRAYKKYVAEGQRSIESKKRPQIVVVLFLLSL